MHIIYIKTSTKLLAYASYLLSLTLEVLLIVDPLSSTVIISRQQRRMQVMRIRQRDDRYRNKKKKKQQHGSTSNHHQAKQLHTEPAYRRKPNPIRRYDTDVLSPVRISFSVVVAAVILFC